VRRIDRKTLILVLSFIIFSFINIDTAIAERWEYTIEDKSGINEYKTTAVVDTEKHEIRLPKSLPNMVDFLGDGFEYIVLTPEGVERVNKDGSMTLVAENGDTKNPISAIAGSNHPDFIVARETTITHYSFTESDTGSEYVPNPIFATGGYTNILSVGTKELDHAVLTSDGKITYRAFTGDAMVPATALSPEGFTNPIAMTVFKDHYGIAVVDGDEVKYFKDGNSVTSTISGLTNILSISAADGGNIAVVANNQVKHYNLLEDSTFAYNSHLSTIEGLTSPTCVALRPGSYDRIIVDGNNVNYYMWTGSEFIKNDVMSKEITGLQDISKYLPKAVAESKVYTTEKPVTHVKLSIEPGLNPQEDDTDIKWYLTASEDENHWVETTLGNWAAMSEPGKHIRWKAVLSSTNRDNTPRINPVIVVQTNSKPNPPELYLPDPGECYLNSAPVIRWKFSDPDGDVQGAYQVRVYRQTGELIVNTGRISTLGAPRTEYIIDPDGTGLLWDTGTNQFSVEVSVWDTLSDEIGVESDPSNRENFCVIAFDCPVATEIITPPSSDKPISKNMTGEQLPETKAGGLVTLQVKSLGVTTASMGFPYLVHNSAIPKEPIIVSGYEGKVNKIWTVSFYTSADTDKCPDGTIVNGLFTGNGIPLMALKGTQPDYKTAPEPTKAKWWQWEGYRWWAEGVVKIDDTAFKNWSVILQGRDK
jgi:hypothetical protein